MTEETKKFIRYLRYGREVYPSDPNAPSDDGGFLIPRQVSRFKPGLIAQFWRFLGRAFNSMSLLDKGCDVYYPYEELFKALDELKSSR